MSCFRLTSPPPAGRHTRRLPFSPTPPPATGSLRKHKRGDCLPCHSCSDKHLCLAPFGWSLFRSTPSLSSGPCPWKCERGGRMVCAGLWCCDGRLWPLWPILLIPGMWPGFPRSPGRPTVALYPCPPYTAGTGPAPGTPLHTAMGGSITLSHTP